MAIIFNKLDISSFEHHFFSKIDRFSEFFSLPIRNFTAHIPRSSFTQKAFAELIRALHPFAMISPDICSDTHQRENYPARYCDSHTR